VLLADEPTGNLDTTTGQSVLALLESLNADGVAVVLVTHDREVAQRAHRQILMRDGLIVAPPPAAVAEDPGNAGTSSDAEINSDAGDVGDAGDVRDTGDAA
jgi:putative ABC transport system ATP-binding protein